MEATENAEMLEPLETSKGDPKLTLEMRKQLKEEEAKGSPDDASILQTIIKEIRPSKELIPIKIISFLFYGGMFAVTPFFVLHMQQLGLSVEEIAVISSILPIPAIIGPVVSGLIADWFSSFKAVLMCNILLSIMFNLATIYIPPIVYIVAPVPAVSFNSSGIALSPLQCYPLDGGSQNAWIDWTCQSSCFNDDAAIQNLFAGHIKCIKDDFQENTLWDDCILPTMEDTKCGYKINFLPSGDAGANDHRIVNDSFHDSKIPCSTSCNKTVSEEVDKPSFSNSKTFWIYLFVRSVGSFFMNASFTMMDASIMAVMLRVGGDFGKQRLIAMLSMASIPFLASVIVQATTANPTDEVDYSPVFYLMTALLCSATVVGYFINLEVETKEKEDSSLSNLMKDLKELFTRVEVVLFLLILFLLGANWGFLENYLFVYLNMLNAPTYMLGLTMTFGCLTGVPMLLVSDRIVEWLGREKVFFIGFLAYTVRMFGYSIISNPWYCFFFEALEVFTYQIMWVASVTYFPILAPTSMLGTLSGIAGAVHYNIGRGGGSFIGGFLIAHLGMIWTFRMFSIASFVFAIFYLVVQKTYLNKIVKKKETEGEQTEDETKETDMAEKC